MIGNKEIELVAKKKGIQRWREKGWEEEGELNMIKSSL